MDEGTKTAVLTQNRRLAAECEHLNRRHVRIVASLIAAERDRDAALAVVRELHASLPRCEMLLKWGPSINRCPRPATTNVVSLFNNHGEHTHGSYCDEHAKALVESREEYTAKKLPQADALARATALLAGVGR